MSSKPGETEASTAAETSAVTGDAPHQPPEAHQQQQDAELEDAFRVEAPDSEHEETAFEYQEQAEAQNIAGARQRTQTNKGREYYVELTKKNIRSAISRWRKQANFVNALLSDSENIDQLRSERNKLSALTDEVSRLGEEYLNLQPMEDVVYERVEAVEQESLAISRRISEMINEIRSEAGSIRSGGSSRRSSRGKQRTKTRDIFQDEETSLKKKMTEDYVSSQTGITPNLPAPQYNTVMSTNQLHSQSSTTQVSLAPHTSAPIYTGSKMFTSNRGLNYNAQPFVPVVTSSVTSTFALGADPFSQLPTAQTTSTVRGPGTSFVPTQHVPVCSGQECFNSLAQVLFQQASLNRLPPPEPGIFSGNPIEYNAWRTSFDLLIDQRPISTAEKLHYLRRYLGGPAKECIEGFLIESSANAYADARRRLDERFGAPFHIANAFRQRLNEWPKIQKQDGTALQKLSDFLCQCESAMKTNADLNFLNDPMENQTILKKLPDVVLTRWSQKVDNHREEIRRSSEHHFEQYCKRSSYPPFSIFVGFISNQARLACDPIFSFQALKEEKSAKPNNKSSKSSKTALSTEVKEEKPKQQNRTRNKRMPCIICKKEHWLGLCDSFKKKSVSQRREFTKQHKLCFNCLTPNHGVKECKSKYSCRHCKKRHATCLHIEEPTTEKTNTKKETQEEHKTSDKEQPTENTETKAQAVNHATRISGGSKSSMIVPVFLSHGEYRKNEVLTYALLDTQSDSSFVSTDVCERLQLHGVDTQLTLSTMTADEEVIQCKKVTNLNVRGYTDDTNILIRSAYTRESIPMNRNHIPSPETARKWPHLSHLANKLPPILDCEIGLLIGYDCPRALTPREVIPGPDEGPYAIRTDLGWSLVGITEPDGFYHDDDTTFNHRITTHEVQAARVSFNTTAVKAKEVINPANVIKMMETDFIEQKTCKKSLSYDDKRFLHILEEGIHTTNDNHFEMPLPFKIDNPLVPDNKELALRRLDHLHKRLKSDPAYRQEYTAFMNEILNSGYAEEVPKDDKPKEGCVSYIPHHGVYHPKKKKLRVVFDCSAKWQGVSINDLLLQGPDLINGLVGILCRFRKEEVAVVCDVKKMFYQFRVNAEHRNFLRFLWYKDGNIDSHPVVYRMTVHLFGAVSSPGCSNFGLQRAAADGEEEFGKQAANFVKHDFYVDDGLTSVESTKEAIDLISNTKALCKKKGIKLHRFASNVTEVLQVIPADERADCVRDIDFTCTSTPIERVLGVQWSLEDDCFRFHITLKDRPATRRGILSAVSAVYDPLGFLSPVVLSGKRILQDICRDQTDWDAPLSDELVSRWRKWCSGLPKLEDLRIPRCYKPQGFGLLKSVELHHFSDASTTGYGQSTYIRLVNTRDEVHCSLVLAKARVTPLRQISVPRLELTAATLSVKIAEVIKNELQFDNIEEHFWTDSKVVLGYICNDARRFHVFVANRVQLIRDSTQTSQWHYVQTADNPADCASRGLTARNLVNSTTWFSGPEFLRSTNWLNYTYDHPIQNTINTDDLEVRRCMATQQTEKFDMDARLSCFSTWFKAKRAIANCLCFMNKLKRQINKEENNNQQHTVETMQQAEVVILKAIQSVEFSEQIRILTNTENQSTKRLRTRDPVLKLDPELDENGILRVGGKLRQSNLPIEEKHPIIVPKNTHVTRLIIQSCHEKVAHQGRGLTLNSIRSHGYCIIGGNTAVRSFISKCVHCRRWRHKPITQKMSDLPEDRMIAAAPFTYCAVDYFGPFMIRIKRSDVPRYGVLFTCLASRAIHLEVAESLDTDAFINALRRLIAIRGPIRLLRSDRGTNFVGAMNEQTRELEAMKNEKLRQFLLHHGADIEFRMNFPSSSHMGGVWERQIRTVRSVLTPMLARSGSQLDDDSLRTLFYEVMNIVNNRPLTTDTLSDESSPAPLTPNHLLTSKTSIVLPPPTDFQEADMYSRKRWRRVQYMLNVFWSRWQVEYLQSLQQRNKWQHPQRETKVGDIVILKDESVSRNHWPLAIVEATYASSDGHIRKVKLRMASNQLDKKGRPTKNVSFLDRPVHKLVLLLEAQQTRDSTAEEP